MVTAATLRYARISPQKCRLVADQIRGQSVAKALEILQFSPKKAAHIVRKVLESAIANAEHNDGADIDELRVSTVVVSEAHGSLLDVLPDLFGVLHRRKGDDSVGAFPRRWIWQERTNPEKNVSLWRS